MQLQFKNTYFLPCFGVEGTDLPEGFLETARADVVDVEVVQVLHLALQITAQGADVGVPQLREGGAVADDRAAHQFVNGLRARCFHHCILRSGVRTG